MTRGLKSLTLAASEVINC